MWQNPKVSRNNFFWWGMKPQPFCASWKIGRAKLLFGWWERWVVLSSCTATLWGRGCTPRSRAWKLGDLRPWGCWSECGLAAWAPLVSTMQHQRLLCEGPGQKSCLGFESHFPEKLHWADVFLWKKNKKISQMNKCFLMEKVVGKILMWNTLQHYWAPSSRAPISSQLVSTVSIQWSPWNSVWYVWRDKGCFTHF